VVQKYRVREIGIIFGSFVRGEQKRRSDVDILVEYDGIPDLFEFINLERYFQCLLRKSPNKPE
jgi:predicted nucleotidyltransferase